MNDNFNKPLTLLLIGLLLTPTSSFADGTPAASSPVIRSVELSKTGTARGLLLDTEGRAKTGQIVELHTNETIYQVTTDQDGYFEIPGLNGGSCVVKVGENHFGCRLWTHGTAPPNTHTSFAVVHFDQPIIRGQSNPALFNMFRMPSGFRMPNGMVMLNPLANLTRNQLIALGLLGAGATVAIVLATQDDGGGNASR